MLNTNFPKNLLNFPETLFKDIQFENVCLDVPTNPHLHNPTRLRLRQTIQKLSKAKCACAANRIACGNFLYSPRMVLWLKK